MRGGAWVSETGAARDSQQRVDVWPSALHPEVRLQNKKSRFMPGFFFTGSTLLLVYNNISRCLYIRVLEELCAV